MRYVLFMVSLYIHRDMVFAQYRPVHTYSIVALDEKTGELGLAVQSHWFSVGSLVPWAQAGVGAVATQSFVKVEYGPEGLALMAKGLTAQDALSTLLDKDENAAVRQVGMVDAKGNSAAHTGSGCIDFAGHIVGKGFSVQANLMENPTVPQAMAEAFRNATGDLAERMMAALEAAEREGGDIRGKQSAAMIVVSGQPTGIPWKDKIVDLRIEDHELPLVELRRLLRINRAYHHANKGDLFMETGKVDSALVEYNKAAEYYPENPELPFWTAVTLVGAEQLDKALPVFKNVFGRNPQLRDLIPRLVQANLFTNDEKIIQQVLKQ